MMTAMRGIVHKYKRANIDTDVIIPGPYLKIHDHKELAKHAMEGLDPQSENAKEESGGHGKPRGVLVGKEGTESFHEAMLPNKCEIAGWSSNQTAVYQYSTISSSG